MAMETKGIRVLLGWLFVYVTMSSLLAKGKLSAGHSALVQSTWSQKQKVLSEDLIFRDTGRFSKRVSSLWKANVESGIRNMAWVGSTYKEEPYTEEEFYRLRESKIVEQIDLLKSEHIAERKAEVDSATPIGDIFEGIDDLLDDFSEKENKAKKSQDDEQYLKDFDEDAVRRRVARKTFVSQSRSVLTPALFVQNEENKLFCYELQTGRALWVIRMGEEMVQQPFETDTELFVVEGGCCKIIDKRSGSLREKMTFSRAVHPKVFSKGDHVYALGFDGRLFSMRRGARYPQWSQRVGGRGDVGVWGYRGGLFVPLENGYCKSFSFSGREQWDFSSKAISEEKIYLEKEGKTRQASRRRTDDCANEGSPRGYGIYHRV